MKKVDAIVFAGGIGENSAFIRSRVCSALGGLGIEIDSDKNESLVAGREGEFSTSQSSRKLLVIPTNEELLIARDTFRCIHNDR